MPRPYAPALQLLLRLSLLNALAFLCIALAGWHTGVREPFPRWFRLGSDLCLSCGIALFLLSLPLLLRTWYRHNAIMLAAVSGATAITVLFLTLHQ